MELLLQLVCWCHRKGVFDSASFSFSSFLLLLLLLAAAAAAAAAAAVMHAPNCCPPSPLIQMP